MSLSMEEEITEGKLFATFEKYDEFLSIQKALLAVDLTAEANDDIDVQESGLFRKLCNIVRPNVHLSCADVYSMP